MSKSIALTFIILIVYKQTPERLHVMHYCLSLFSKPFLLPKLLVKPGRYIYQQHYFAVMVSHKNYMGVCISICFFKLFPMVGKGLNCLLCIWLVKS